VEKKRKSGSFGDGLFIGLTDKGEFKWLFVSGLNEIYHLTFHPILCIRGFEIRNISYLNLESRAATDVAKRDKITLSRSTIPERNFCRHKRLNGHFILSDHFKT